MTALAEQTDLLSLFADPARVRICALLADAELSVSELVAITDLAQSRVSTHLARLRQAGVVRERRVGSSTRSMLNDEAMPGPAARLWSLVRESVDDAVLAADRRRCEEVLRRREKGRFPENVAGAMERSYSPGRTWESLARGLIPLLELGDVLDVGAGDGAIAEMLAPRARSIRCVDVHPKLLAAAKARLAHRTNVTVEAGDMHALPFEDASFDVVLLLSVLTATDRPSPVVAECARVLRPRGRLLIGTLDAHDRLDLTEPYGHVRAGIRAGDLRAMLRRAGLEVATLDVVCRERKHPELATVVAVGAKP